MLKDILQFSWEVTNNWAGYSTGGIIAALIFWWSAWSGKGIRRAFLATLAILFFATACFEAWEAQHTALVNATKSDVRWAVINGGYMGISPTQDRINLSCIGVGVVIDNWGAKIGIRDLRLDLNTTMGSSIPGRLMDTNETLLIRQGLQKKEQELHQRGLEVFAKGSYLPDAINSPLDTGVKIEGYAFFAFPIPSDEMRRVMKSVTVRFMDTHSNVYSNEIKDRIGQNLQ